MIDDLTELETAASDVAAFWIAGDVGRMTEALNRHGEPERTLTMGLALGRLSRLPDRQLFRAFLADVVNPHMRATGGHEYKVPIS